MTYRKLIKKVIDKIALDNVGLYTGQVTLFTIMAAIPFILVVISLVRFTPLREDEIILAIDTVLPHFLVSLIEGVIKEMFHSTVFVVVSFVIMVYSAAKAIHSLRVGLETVYETGYKTNWFAMRARSMLDTFLFAVIIIAAQAFIVFGNRIEATLERYNPAVGDIVNKLLLFKGPVLAAVLFLVFLFAYKVLPHGKFALKKQIPGAAGSAVVWMIFSYILAIYVNFFSGFSLYGSMTGIVLIMVWLYNCVYAFYVCGIVNFMWDELKADLREAHAYRKAVRRGEREMSPDRKVVMLFGKKRRNKAEDGEDLKREDLKV